MTTPANTWLESHPQGTTTRRTGAAHHEPTARHPQHPGRAGLQRRAAGLACVIWSPCATWRKTRPAAARRPAAHLHPKSEFREPVSDITREMREGFQLAVPADQQGRQMSALARQRSAARPHQAVRGFRRADAYQDVVGVVNHLRLIARGVKPPAHDGAAGRGAPDHRAAGATSRLCLAAASLAPNQNQKLRTPCAARRNIGIVSSCAPPCSRRTTGATFSGAPWARGTRPAARCTGPTRRARGRGALYLIWYYPCRVPVPAPTYRTSWQRADVDKRCHSRSTRNAPD